MTTLLQSPPNAAPNAEEERALFAAMHDPDGTPESRSAARDELILRNLRLVPWSLKNIRCQLCDFGDVCGYGYVALIDAIERFDASRGTRFSTFARAWVRGKVIREIRDREFRIRVPVGVYDREKGYGRPLDGQEISRAARRAERTGSYGSPSDFADRLPFEPEYDLDPSPAEVVAKLLARIPGDLADVVRRAYGIGCRPQTAEEIGAAIGLTKSGAKQRLDRARSLLRRRCKEVAA